MTDTKPAVPGISWDEDSGGATLHLELGRERLLPGQLVSGRILITAHGTIEARGVVVALKAVEHWRHRETHTDANGATTTTVVTTRADVTREPVDVHGPLRLAAGGTLDQTFEMPVPPDGPASLEADDAGLDWTIEAKLDVADDFDIRIEKPVVVAQPTALLMVGAVRLGEFALMETADVADGEAAGSITVHPAPLVSGQPFTGRVELKLPGNERLQEVRGELRVTVKATVSEGESQVLTLWEGQLAPAGDLAGTTGFDIAGTLPARPVPSIELPHGRTDATFHVILAKAWAPDTHLVRDVAIATTAEI